MLGSRLKYPCQKLLHVMQNKRIVRHAHDLRVKVLYDGECPLCVSEIKFLMWKDKQKKNISFIDISKPDYDEEDHRGISYGTAMEQMHVIGKDGKIHTGVSAMQEMYAAVGLAWVWGFYNMPLFTKVTDKAYDWFAKNRLWLTRRDTECSSGKCGVATKQNVGSNTEEGKNNSR